MSKHRRLKERQRKPRGRFIGITAAMAVAAVVAAGIAYEAGRGDAQTGQLAQAEPQTALLVPAAAPARDAEPAPLEKKPGNQPARGMVYDGLKPAEKGDRCAGVYATDAGHCTHGPDAPPKGVDIKKDTPPAVKSVARAADPAKPAGDPAPAQSGGRAQDAPAVDAQARGNAAAAPTPGASKSPAGRTAAAGPAGQTVQCDGDGNTGNRVQVVYVHGPGKDRYSQYVASFRKWAADADVIYSASAEETGGVRHIRYVTAADCTPTVLNIELPDSALAEFSATNRALAAKGLDRRDRKYMIFADAQVYCGIGTFNGDERPQQNNLSNFGPSYGRTDSGCWGGHTAAHELGHNLGAVNNSAPNTSRGAHCTDEWDVMCYSDSPHYPQMRNICTNRASDNILDCNHDDYFHTNPRAGSYLATHWNIADNQFLMRGKGGGGGTDPDPDPSPTPKPSPTPTTPEPGTGPDVTVGQIQSDSAVVSWPKVPGAAWYQVFLGGRQLTWVQGTVLRVYRLQPGTSYKVAVSVRDGQGRDSGPGKATRFTTKEAGGGSTKPSSRYVLGNGSTGMNAELWGGRSADGTILVGSAANGYAHQQWYFDDAGNGLVRIRSAASGKCLQPGGAPSAGMWIAQQPCGSAKAQQWKLNRNGAAVTVTDRSGDYALSISNRPYYGAWLLDLQHTNGRPAQAWTLQKTG
ncbi:RICIN domain-containing protein [Streptomyces bambusae]|uniref:RICIN domain-containing protein n=1 Tax=Streptomyces bambusae TaxID=1550616 RepID=UPI001CFC9E99|nr:RICIN domain-containing protein [Streptomyces bambusae]MCB5165780.1 RICIN domain-containing protein [Streptomyces bambusae]